MDRLHRWGAWIGLVLAMIAGAGCQHDESQGTAPLPDLSPSCPASPESVITPPSVEVSCPPGATTVQVPVTLSSTLGERVVWKSTDPNGLIVDAENRVFLTCPIKRGGPYLLTAEGSCGYKPAELTIRDKAPDVIDQGVSPSAPDSFNGPPSMDPQEWPEIAYPFEGSMHPPNLLALTLQWRAAAAHEYFRVHVSGDFIDQAFYLARLGHCTDDGARQSCAYRPPADAWKTVVSSAKSGSLKITVSGVHAPNAPVASSAPRTIRVSPESVNGGFHYFAGGISGIKRIAFGAIAPLTAIQGGPSSDIKCAGCHALSRDGTRLAATFYGADGQGGVVDVRTGKFAVAPAAPPYKSWNFATFSPDGNLLLTNWQGVLTLRDGVTGARKYDVDPSLTGGLAIMPAWSPDGTRVAFVQLPPEGRLGRDVPGSNLKAGDWVVANTGNIAVMSFAGGAFEAARVIVPSIPQREYHYSPSWSPRSDALLYLTVTAPGDSPEAWLYFGGSPIPNYVMNYQQRDTRMWLVSADGGTPVDLPSANHAGHSNVAWPRFAPFTQGSLAFFTFSSRFDYGLWSTKDRSQLWMAAIDLDAALHGAPGDPSNPPIWLPFQELGDFNYDGEWATQVPCANDNDCGGYRCQSGACTSP